MRPLPRPREAFSVRYDVRYWEFMLFDRAVIARQIPPDDRWDRTGNQATALDINTLNSGSKEDGQAGNGAF